MRIEHLQPDDHAWWLASRRELFGDEDAGILGEEERQIVAGSFRGMSCVVLVAWDGGDRVGFAEVGLRSGAEGCMTSPVCYLEGWWVSESARGTGVGRVLVEAAAAWGRQQGCVELASDTEAHNAQSRAAHEALGFEALEPIVCFRKRIG